MRLNKFTGLFMAAVLAVATFNFVPAKKASADNPVVQTYFTADPSPLVVGDTLYLITSHDEDVLEKNKPTDDYLFFTMKNWKCYSTKDMVIGQITELYLGSLHLNGVIHGASGHGLHRL